MSFPHAIRKHADYTHSFATVVHYTYSPIVHHDKLDQVFFSDNCW